MDVPEASPCSPRSRVSKPVIKWRRLPDLPSGMFLPQVVVTSTAVYIGGGVSRKGMLDIYSYDLGSGSWSTLPCNNVMVFGMCMFREQLITVGGGTVQGLTNKVFSWDPLSEVQKWEQFPSMGCARMALTAISMSSFMVAIGGAVWAVGKKDPTPVSTVEVYHSKTEQWQRVNDVLFPCASMSTSVMRDVCYLMGNIDPDEKRKVLCIDLLQFENPVTPSIEYHTIPESPTRHSSFSTSESCSTPISLSPYSSPSHILSDSMAAVFEGEAASSADDTLTQNSVSSSGTHHTSHSSYSSDIPDIIITSSQCHPQHTPASPEHFLSHVDSASADNAASATAPQASCESSLAHATPLTHSPVNAVSSLTDNTSVLGSCGGSPSSSCSSSIAFSSSPSHNVATPSHLQPITEVTYSQSMPDLDKIPNVKTPYCLYPRASEVSDWYTLPPPPTENGCILGINDHLISFGGHRNGDKFRAMLIYSKRYSRWLKVLGAGVPIALEGCSCAVLQTGEIILVGGEDAEGEYSSGVFIGSAT